MFEKVNEFEKVIADYFGAPYAIATDCCTHGLELSLIYAEANKITIPEHTYLSVPMTAVKLRLDWEWKQEYWRDYYNIGNTNVIDAAVLWKHNSYVPGSFMCISFQYRKHLNLGKGGMILTDDKAAYEDLVKLSYDGRSRDKPWAQQSVETIGYHYYMTPETAMLGLEKFPQVRDSMPKTWGWENYPNLQTMPVFMLRS